MMKCYKTNCVNNNEWACCYRDDCDYCSKDCKNYYQCLSCDYYMDESIDEAYSELDKIPFPFQYIEEYFQGKSSFDCAIDKTIDEVYRLVIEYIENNKEDI